MYRSVDAKQCLVDAYAVKLADEEIFSMEQVEAITAEHTEKLGHELELVDSGQSQTMSYNFSKFSFKFQFSVDHLGGYWKGFYHYYFCFYLFFLRFRQAPSAITKWDTGIDTELLKFVAAASVAVPNAFVRRDNPFKICKNLFGCRMFILI